MFIYQKSVQKLNDTIYVFLDEICKADVIKGSSESLVGRISPYTMLSMEFLDVVMYHEKDNNLDYLFNRVNCDLREAFLGSIKIESKKRYIWVTLD